MAAVVTAQKEEFVEIYPYRFNVAKMADADRLFVGVIRLDNRDMDKSDMGEVDTILKDLGKWETLKQAGSVLLGELGYAGVPEVKEIMNYSSSRYSFDEAKVNRSFREGPGFWVGLGRDERKRRETKGLGSYPTTEEIASELSKVQKWRAVRKAIEYLRTPL